MQPNVCFVRGSATGVFAARAAALGAVLMLAAPVHARSAAAQRSAAPAAEAAPWIACSTADDPAQEAQQPQTASGQARIVVRGGTMSLEVRGCTLPQLLSLIASRAGVRISVSDALPPVPLSVRTPSQSIEATIRELLRDTDVFVLYAAEPDAAQRLAAVWVYPRGSARGIEPLPAALWASTRELQHQLTEWSPDLRARAIEELIARTGDAALPDVFTALADGDADIRQRALDAALAAGLDVPLQQLHALTLDDPSPEVRLRALQALEGRPESASTIEAATHDPDANVRREAQSILTRLSQAGR
jgi:hypothetical protein